MTNSDINIFMIVSGEPFPIGMACTNRILSLAKGFTEKNIYVKVVCIRTTERPDQIINKDVRGIINGIEYEYSCGTTVHAKNYLRRRWLRLKGLVSAIITLSRASSKINRNIIMLWVKPPLLVILFYLVSRFLGFYFVRDMTEFPFVFFNKSIKGRMYDFFYRTYFGKLFDAILVMTKPLEQYYKNRIRKNAKLLLVPMTVECSRFIGHTFPRPDDEQYIAYCGYVGGNKDGVPILLKAFSLMAKRVADVKLFIIGDAPGTNELESLKQLSIQLGISDRVVFTGRVLREEMPKFLCNASILALARPNSSQSEGGFPSKLGEYLATGNPVVVTKVGDIPLYLKDKEDAFIAEPDSADSFADYLEYVLNNPEIAKKVGLNGREVALKYFDYRTQAEKVIDYFKNITD